MCRKLFAVLIIVLALLIAVLVSVLPQDKLAGLFYVSRFIEVMIPVLGAGALIKYLFACGSSACCCGGAVCKNSTNP
jgi:ABC-type sugar transport system permease subunit